MSQRGHLVGPKERADHVQHGPEDALGDLLGLDPRFEGVGDDLPRRRAVSGDQSFEQSLDDNFLVHSRVSVPTPRTSCETSSSERGL